MVVRSNESARGVSGRADLREVPKKPWDGKLNLKFLSREAGNQEQDSGYIIREIRFAMEFSEHLL